MSALREVFARFGIEVDTKPLQEGERGVNRLEDVFERMERTLTRIANTIDTEVHDISDSLHELDMPPDLPRALDETADKARAAGPAVGGLEGRLGGLRAGALSAAAGVAGVGVAVGAVLGRIVGATTEFAHQNTELALNAQRLGVSTNQLQALGLMAADSGQDLDAMTDAMSTLQERMRDAVQDPRSDPAVQLRALGIAIPRTMAEMPDAITLLEQASDGLAGMSNQTDRVGAAMTVFGDVGRELLPTLQQGSGAVQRYSAELEEMGGGVTPDAIEASQRLVAQQARLDLAFRSLQSSFFQFFLPVIEAGTTAATRMAGVLSEHPHLMEAIGIAAAALGVAMAVAFAPAIAAALPVVAVMILIAAAIGIVILVIEDLIVWVEGGESGLQRLAEAITGIDNLSFDRVKRQFLSFLRTWVSGYNTIAGAVGLPTIDDRAFNDSPAGGGGGGGRATLRSPGTTARAVTPSEGGTRPAGGGNTVNQNTVMNITGSNPQEIARRVQEVMDRSNRDAAEAVAT